MMANASLPSNLFHRDRQTEAQQEPPKEKPLLGLAYSDHSVIESAIVMLKFDKAGAQHDGNGFFVRIPGAAKDVIFTAGHNLIDEQKKRCENIRIWWASGKESAGEKDCMDWMEIKDEKNVRISKKYEENPTSASAMDDYGIIMIDRPKNTPPRPGLGFALKLADEESFDESLSVTAYRSGAARGSRPTTSSGKCVNPIINRNQLEYLVETEAGVSGCPVWLGYNRYPTVVAIHNYGPRIKRPNYGSRGTRVNLKVLEEIFQWVGVFQRAKTLQVRGVKMPYPLFLTWSQEDQILRVVVQQSTNPALMQFDVLPVYGPPVVPGKTLTAEFGFSQQHPDGTRWISWNVGWRSATLVNDLRKARSGLWASRKHSGSVQMSWQGNVWELTVRTDSRVVKKWDLEDPGAEFSGIDYETPDNRIDGSHPTFVLK